MKVTFRSEAPADIPFYAGTHVTGLVSTTMRLGYSLYVPPTWVSIRQHCRAADGLHV